MKHVAVGSLNYPASGPEHLCLAVALLSFLLSGAPLQGLIPALGRHLVTPGTGRQERKGNATIPASTRSPPDSRFVHTYSAQWSRPLLAARSLGLVLACLAPTCVFGPLVLPAAVEDQPGCCLNRRPRSEAAAEIDGRN